MTYKDLIWSHLWVQGLVDAISLFTEYLLYPCLNRCSTIEKYINNTHNFIHSILGGGGGYNYCKFPSCLILGHFKHQEQMNALIHCPCLNNVCSTRETKQNSKQDSKKTTTSSSVPPSFHQTFLVKAESKISTKLTVQTNNSSKHF